MCSIATKYIVANVIVHATSLASAAPLEGPRILREPVFGLRYEAALVKFDPLPPNAIAHCRDLLDDENGRAKWFIHAQASDASSKIYYVIGGYEARSGAPQAHQRYETEGLGVVFSTEGSECTIIDSARQVFNDRLFDEDLPQAVLKRLAADVARRLVRAFGSEQRLNAELRRQRIDLGSLPPELTDAIAPYTGRNTPER